VPAPRQAHLDGLRGFAAAIVAVSLCIEFIVPPLAGEPEASLRRILAYDFNMADAGFVALFALSGYLIPHSFGGAHPLRNFVLKRGLRLYPTFLVAGLLALCLLPLAPGFHPTWRQLVKSFVTMHPLTASAQFDHSHWVLALLLMFYALSIGAAGLNLLGKRWFAISVAFGLLALCGGLTAIGSLYHRHFPILALLCLAVAHFGSFVRQRQDAGAVESDRAFVVVTAAFWSALLLIVGLAWSPHWGLGELWLGKALAFAAGGALFLYGVLRRRMAASRLRYLGDTSYAMYFFLPLLLSAANPYVAQNNLGARLAAAAAVLALAFAAAAVTFRWAGKPSTNLSHRLVADVASGAPVLQPHPPVDVT